MLRIFDVMPSGENRFTGESDGGGRQVVDGTQLLAQAIVAVAKRLPDKEIRSARAVFSRTVDATEPVDFEVDVVHEGRTMASANVAVRQRGRRRAMVSVLADAPTPDVIRHQAPRPDVAGPAEAHPVHMPMTGRELRVVDVVDLRSPEEVGPPELYAWLRYEPIPTHPALAKALVAHFTGHLSVSATMRAHEGVGTSQAHRTISTGVMTVAVAFHEPVRWDGWLLYSHESTQVGAGMSYVRGQVHTESGELLASFTQEAMIRPLTADHSAVPAQARL
ncbi:acyl-CoA thioesterase [Rhodococcus chondri]|uniref:Thioesterase family protein n=1 Tax=Rhodococcus chondri TaxID=3065941 RepID=A0ABU7JR61_9NOCA|nr:acyl-CoA thioesterase domain-containing protein [Rhodococcus sp. CC-R104]MEE2032505.1 thioesterase family protein [Rhodococcus sp. CC-R104]